MPNSGGHTLSTDTAVPGSAAGTHAHTTAVATAWAPILYTAGRLACVSSVSSSNLKSLKVAHLHASSWLNRLLNKIETGVVKVKLKT